MLLEYLDIIGAEIPSEKFFDIDGIQYLFRIRNNEHFLNSENLTCEIFDGEGRLVYANKIVYGVNFLFVPQFKTKIIALNVEKLAGLSNSDYVNETTLGETVLLVTDIR